MWGNCSITNYLLSIMIITSNIFTTYFIYPILADYIQNYGNGTNYYLIGLYIGLILGLYDLFRILGSYLWKKIANFTGIAISINISLLLLTICNFSFCFTKSLNMLIINRLLTGLFN